MARVRAAVIGSGFGGLASAIRLQAAGCRTMIFEKRDLAGGRAYVYRDQGFTFDAGSDGDHGAGLFAGAFQRWPASPWRITWSCCPSIPFIAYFGRTATSSIIPPSQALIERQIEKKSPADVAGYKQFLKYSEKVFHEGYEKLAHVPFLNWWSMVSVAPQLIRLQAFRSVYSMVSKYMRDPHLGSCLVFIRFSSAAIRSPRRRFILSFIVWNASGACSFRKAAPARWCGRWSNYSSSSAVKSGSMRKWPRS